MVIGIDHFLLDIGQKIDHDKAVSSKLHIRKGYRYRYWQKSRIVVNFLWRVLKGEHWTWCWPSTTAADLKNLIHVSCAVSNIGTPCLYCILYSIYRVCRSALQWRWCLTRTSHLRPYQYTIPWFEYSSSTFSNLVEPHVRFTASRQNIFHFENKLHFSQLTTSQTSHFCPA